MTAERKAAQSPSSTDYATVLECFSCGSRYQPERHTLLCTCGMPLEQRYDLARLVADGRGGQHFAAGPPGVWRYRSLLPLAAGSSPVSLGEGATPLVRLPTLSARLGVELVVKDESRNPTGSFKARGASVGVSRLAQLGWPGVVIPTTGNGGSAWSAYAARAGLVCRVALMSDDDLPRIGAIEPVVYGATVLRLANLSRASTSFADHDLADLAYVGGLHEPYRMEGDKTILFELVEQLGWRTPDVLLWPTGGAVGLVGIAKAFEELKAIGALDPQSAMTLVAAQHESAAPIANALHDGSAQCRPGIAAGIAPGVRVGDPFAAEYVLSRVRSSAAADGVWTGDAETLATLRMVARTDGLLLSPEGALAVAGAIQLVEAGSVRPGVRVVCINTASGLRYPHLFEPDHGQVPGSVEVPA